ncbi:molecular chaperone DnaJ [Ornithobacterium rhinotracheale]|uniref:molecular chaperone DnaJ n=1 Tax=Ornithobacterium rhinotracheale TaxID=28251 RepID=UPI003FA4AFF9
MKDILIDSLNTEKGVISIEKTPTSFDIWFWASLIELLVILVLLLYILYVHKKVNKFNRNTKNEINNLNKTTKEEVLGEHIDFDNIIKSSFQAKKLYNNLIVKCHPDRFPTDPKKNAIANELFQEITKNKTDLKKLLELKSIAEIKLKIKN